MGEQGYIRARSAEQKQERMAAIMAAADELFSKMPYHKITMGTIAQELGWSRAGLYKYASTQEEIFLALHSEKNRAWLEELCERLAAAPMDAEGFARIWAETTEKHGAFLRYQDILISIIESNVTIECLTEFKRDFARMLGPVTSVLMAQCGTSETAAQELYLRLLFQAPALYFHYYCPELTRTAMERAGMTPPSGSFVEAYASFVKMCLADAMQALR